MKLDSMRNLKNDKVTGKELDRQQRSQTRAIMQIDADHRTDTLLHTFRGGLHKKQLPHLREGSGKT